MNKRSLSKTSKFNYVFAFSLIVSLFLISGIVHADVTIIDDYEMKTTYYKGSKRAEVDEVKTSIVDIVKEKGIEINHENQVYAEGTIDEFFNETFKAFREMMGLGLSDEERREQFIQQMMEEGMTREQAEPLVDGMMKLSEQYADEQKGDVKVEKGKTEKMAGYKSEQYFIKLNGNLEKEAWISSAVKKLIEKEFDINKFDEIIKGFQKEMTQMMETAMKRSLYDPVEEALHKLEENGYLMMEGYPEISPYTEADITIDTGKIDNSVFEIPEGYEKVSLEEFILMEYSDD